MHTLHRSLAAGLFAAASLTASTARADIMNFVDLSTHLNDTIVSWSDGGSYAPLFPGTSSWNGIDFQLQEDMWGLNVVHNPGSADIDVNVTGATAVYTLMNTAWGSYGSVNGKLEFFGSGGAYHSMDLTQGINIRDHFNGGFNNIIDGVNAVSAFTSPGGARLDMQIFFLPVAFQAQTLTSVRFLSWGGSPSGSPFMAGMTVVSTPEPQTLLLLGIALAGLGWRRRWQ